jgi:hypothetical protein
MGALMSRDWSFILTPQFLVGTMVAGLLLDVVGTYLVRWLDRIKDQISSGREQALSEESQRVGRLTEAALSDTALYAALAAEGTRLRLDQLLKFLGAFFCIYPLIVVIQFGEAKPGLLGIAGRISLVAIVAFGLIQYVRGLRSVSRARRLDLALDVARRHHTLPIMD